MAKTMYQSVLFFITLLLVTWTYINKPGNGTGEPGNETGQT